MYKDIIFTSFIDYTSYLQLTILTMKVFAYMAQDHPCLQESYQEGSEHGRVEVFRFQFPPKSLVALGCALNFYC